MRAFLVAILAAFLCSVGPTLYAQPRYDVAAGRLNAFLALAERTARAIDRTGFDVNAKAHAIGADPHRLFEFVRDAVRFEAYSGSLRGEQGTLEGLAGNSVDQSLLLAALLRAAGYADVTLVHGELSEAQTLALARQMYHDAIGFELPDTAALPKGTRAAIAEAGGISTAELNERLLEFDTLLIAERERLGDVAYDDARLVTAAADRMGVIPRTYPALSLDSILPALKRHVWVRFTDRTGHKIDLDPSFATAAFGQRIATERGLLPAKLPDNWMHTVTVTLRVERSDGDKLAEDVLWQKTFYPATITSSAIEFELVPSQLDAKALHNGTLAREGVLQAYAQSDAYQLIVRINDHSEAAAPFDLSGRKRDVKQGNLVAAATAGAFNSFACRLSGDCPSAKPTKLTGLWFDITSARPTADGSRKSEAYRATLLDRLAPRSRGSGKRPVLASALAEDNAVRARLALAGEIGMTAYARNRTALAERWLQRTANLAPMLRRAQAWKFKQAAPESLPDFKTGTLALQVLTWALLSEDIAADRATGGMPVRAYYDRPRIVVYTTQVTSPGIAAGDPVTTHQFNVLENRLRVVAGRRHTADDASEAEAAALAYATTQGAADTLAEAWILGNESTVSAHNVISAAIDAHQPLSILAPNEAATASQLKLGEDAKREIADDLRRGYVVVAPTAPVALAGGSRIAWWRYNPTEGTLLGRGLHNTGQAFSEYLSASNVTRNAAIGVLIAHVVCAITSHHRGDFHQCLRDSITSEMIVFGGLLLFPGVAGYAGGALLAGGGFWLGIYGLATNNPVALGVGLGFMLPGIGHGMSSSSSEWVSSPFLRRVGQEANALPGASGLRPALAGAGDTGESLLSRIFGGAARDTEEGVLSSRAYRNPITEWFQKHFPPKPPPPPYGRAVKYGAKSNLSKLVVKARKAAEGGVDTSGSNYAVIEYITKSGNLKQVVGKSLGAGTPHGEKAAWALLPKYVRNNPGRYIRGLYTELSPCRRCEIFLERVGVPRGRVSYSFEYARDYFRRLKEVKRWREAVEGLG